MSRVAEQIHHSGLLDVPVDDWTDDDIAQAQRLLGDAFHALTEPPGQVSRPNE